MLRLALLCGALCFSACGNSSQDTHLEGAQSQDAITKDANTGTVSASDASLSQRTILEKPAHYSPYVEQNFPNTVYFGDTHLHTSYSFDAGMVGDRLDPEQAYRFAKGEVVTASLGAKAKLSRPLDFLVIADHAESLGIAPLIAENSPIVLNDPEGKQLYDLSKGDDPIAAYRRFAQIRATTGRPPLHNNAVRRTMWDRITTAAENHNQPGQFTSLMGYEYTSSMQTNNLHRVVVFRDGKDKVGSILPFSAVESADPEDLWAFLENYETTTGGRAMAIPHNGNLSNGTMFDDIDIKGEPFDTDYSARRQRWEPLYEVTQIKGDGEAHPILSPNDEFADFWTWDKGNFGFAEKTPDMLAGEYAREALKRGLKFEEELGVNPFKFGLIGSTDSHTSLATAEENNFFSKATPAEPEGTGFRYNGAIIQKYPGKDVDVRVYSYESAAAGLTAVWAQDNTREALFDAMARKEVYATTGTRLQLRVFSGYDFLASDAFAPNLAEIGYAKGSPMGSDLPEITSGSAPQFLIQALRDPDGANLDRIQVIKGWLNEDGDLKEQVYNVAWAGDRTRDDQGKLPAISSTVKDASYLNTVGDAELATVWTDPDFNASERAFYYVRVLEIPTPTWLAYNADYYGDGEQLKPDAKKQHQERAYSSPIWYTPK
ncbi:DUF3604 domain-containing protein [Fretibacter rubidus]|uniref:DUF3604 domain-containing protein n=1 Tax=Fretibacter rubidus TaxID=570162 RepID=UPI00352B659A